MSVAGIASRVARLERSAENGDTCPQHDLVIVVRSGEDKATTGSQEPEPRACQRCGRPASEFWIGLTIVPDRCREEPDG